MASKKYRCCVCRTELEDYTKSSGRPICERCKLLRSAPICLACGEPVMGAKKSDPNPYHTECRRCSSCYKLVAAEDSHMLAGRLLCLSCSHLLGKFFVPTWESECDKTKEIFAAWDSDGSGQISSGEMARVLKALDPDFNDHDVVELLRGIDQDSNGKIDYTEFCEWIMKGDNLIQLSEDSLEMQVKGLMKEAAHARRFAKMDVHSVIMRRSGLYFVAENGLETLESKAVHRPRDAVEDEEVAKVELGEFIVRVEGSAAHFVVHFNTGRVAEIHSEGRGGTFGPFQAPEGFCITGVRTKPSDDDPDMDRIVGVDLAPLYGAASYNLDSAMIYAGQQGFLDTMAKFKAKGINIDAFSPGGATALMLAAQNGAVESMRMLMVSKADAGIADPDGWTALTFASRFGCSAAVDMIIEHGGAVASDGGEAVKQALRNRHGTLARKLLRAGMGQAKPGTFVLEEPPAACTLQTPVVTPNGGAYDGPVIVRISQPEGDPAPKEGEPSRMRILYTLDGSDPFLLGHQVRGPLKVKSKFTRLRAVTVRGRERSAILNATFNICDYALPDVVVSGTLRIRTFPEAVQLLEASLADALHIPAEMTRLKMADTIDETAGACCWIQVPVTDPMPKQRLVIDRPFSALKGAASRRPFVEKFTEDVRHTTGGKPLVSGFTGDKSKIFLDFSLPREQVEELGAQLSDPQGYLKTRGKLKDNWQLASLESFEPLGDKLCDTAFSAALHNDLGSKAEVNEVVSVGSGDFGTIALSVPRSQVSKVQKKIGAALKKGLKAWSFEVGNISVHPEECSFNYSISIVTNGVVDPAAIMRQMNHEDFTRQFSAEVAHHSASAQVAVQSKATKRTLSQMLVKLHWDFPTPGEEAYMDCICLAYADEELAEVVDFKSSARAEGVFDGPASPQVKRRALAVNHSITHSGDILSETGGAHEVLVDLQALGPVITDIYFVLAAFDCEDISIFPSPSISISDPTTGNKLTEYTLSDSVHSEAVVMSVLSRSSGSWMVNHLGIPTDGQVGNFKPIQATLAEYTREFLHPERLELVKLKALLKSGRALPGKRGAEFEKLVSGVMELPLGPFQSVVMCL